VQIPERVSFGHLNTPPDWRVDVQQSNLELIYEYSLSQITAFPYFL
jgi:hypothetical protein